MSVLIIVAHPDDEIIGMGGTIAKHVSKGDKVCAMCLTDGTASRNKDEKAKTQRAIAADLAAKEMGYEWVGKFDLPDNALDSVPLIHIVKLIEEIKDLIRPSLVYTHSSADLNVDHRVIVNSVLTAFRPQPLESCKEIRLFEVASATDFGNSAVTGIFTPNLYIDIENEWEAKYNALNIYGSEIRDYPHSRSIQGIMNLAKIRGNQVGLKLAEAFEIIRKVDK